MAFQLVSMLTCFSTKANLSAEWAIASKLCRVQPRLCLTVSGRLGQTQRRPSEIVSSVDQLCQRVQKCRTVDRGQDLDRSGMCALSGGRHLNQQAFSIRRENNALQPSIDFRRGSPQQAARFQPGDDIRQRGTIDTDFMCQTGLFQAGLLGDGRHHTVLHWRDVELRAFLYEQRCMNLMQPTDQKSRAGCEVERRGGRGDPSIGHESGITGRGTNAKQHGTQGCLPAFSVQSLAPFHLSAAPPDCARPLRPIRPRIPG